MSNENRLLQIPHQMSYFDRAAQAITNRGKINRSKLSAFCLYTICGVVAFILGGHILITNNVDTPMSTLGYAVLAFGVSLIAIGFTFLDFRRDQELEDVTAGVYVLLRNSLQIPGQPEHPYKFVGHSCDPYYCTCQPTPSCSCSCHSAVGN